MAARAGIPRERKIYPPTHTGGFGPGVATLPPGLASRDVKGFSETSSRGARPRYTRGCASYFRDPGFRIPEDDAPPGGPGRPNRSGVAGPGLPTEVPLGSNPKE